MKMRRPTKGLVDAVPTGSKSAAVHPEPSTSTGERLRRSTSIKRTPSYEPGVEGKRVSISASRAAKEEIGELQSPLREKLDRLDQSYDRPHKVIDQAQPNGPTLSTAGSKTIAALMAAKSGRRVTSNETSAPITATCPADLPSMHDLPSNVDTKKDKSDIFEFTDSSPVEPPTSSQRRTDLAKHRSNIRRHSSNPTISKPDPVRAKREDSLASLQTRSRSMRSLSSSSLHSTSTAASRGRGDVKAPDTSGSSLASRRSRQARRISPPDDREENEGDGAYGGGSVDVQVERGARRRSMMV